MGEEFCSAIAAAGFEDAEDGVQEFASDGDERLEFSFMSRLEQFIEGPHVRVVTCADQGRDVERAPQLAVAVATDARLLAHRAARDRMHRIEAAVGDPLAHGHLRGEPGQFAQQLHGARDAASLVRPSAIGQDGGRSDAEIGTDRFRRLAHQRAGANLPLARGELRVSLAQALLDPDCERFSFQDGP